MADEPRRIGVTITQEAVTAAARQAVPPLLDYAETAFHDEERLASALAQAFVDGVLFANTQWAAQLVEVGVNVQITAFEVASILDDPGDE